MDLQRESSGEGEGGPEGGSKRSLAEVHGSVGVPKGGSWVRRFLAFCGPGYLVSVGYMDPGNWATCLAGGSRFGYTLLSVILISNLMAMVLQALAARLGIGAGLDLAQACRAHYRPWVGYGLWLVCELAIIACDLAEVIGTALALKLLFGVPMLWGALLTVADAVLVLMLMKRGFRWLEAFIMALIALIMGCFVVQIVSARPAMAELMAGMVPSAQIALDPAMLYVAIGILGATVMPHNLYLHSSLVQTRAFERSESGRRAACCWATLDSSLALGMAFFVNASILVLAAAVFHKSGRTEVVEIAEAHAMLSPPLGGGMAAGLFAVALLASGLNSTVTGTLAGQIVMEGFLDLRLKPWARRLLTRGLAVLPVVAVTACAGESETGRLLVLSQVILSMQLPFAVVPLVQFVSSRKVMGNLRVPLGVTLLAALLAALIIVLNGRLLWDTLAG